MHSIRAFNPSEFASCTLRNVRILPAKYITLLVTNRELSSFEFPFHQSSSTAEAPSLMFNFSFCDSRELELVFLSYKVLHLMVKCSLHLEGLVHHRFQHECLYNMLVLPVIHKNPNYNQQSTSTISLTQLMQLAYNLGSTVPELEVFLTENLATIHESLNSNLHYLPLDLLHTFGALFQMCIQLRLWHRAAQNRSLG